MNNCHEFLVKIHRVLEEQKYSSLSEIKSEISNQATGFYWLYTRLGHDSFLNSVEPTNNAHVNIKTLTEMHKNLKCILPEQSDQYWCIYNGKGKRLKNRIVAEFSNTTGATGTLALSRCFSHENFKIKYITCNKSQNNFVGHSYAELQKDTERLWRLQYGWPILCRS